MAQLKAIVIGLGNIGMGYDYQTEERGAVLTHAKAFQEHPGFRLIAGVDPCREKRYLFEKKYKVKAYENISTPFNEEKPDVVSIAVPSNLHKDVFAQVIEFGIKHVLCEKPMGDSLRVAKEICEISKKCGINTVVNYIRRFDPGIKQLKLWLEEGNIGKIEKIHVWYSGEMWTNASHFIDLVLYLFEGDGSVSNVTIIHRDENHGPDFSLGFESGFSAFFNSAKSESYEILECEIIGQQGRVKLINGGREIRIEIAEDDVLFPGYKVLKEKDLSFKTDVTKYQYHVMDHLYKSIDCKDQVPSNYLTALKTSSILQNLDDQLLTQR